MNRATFAAEFTAVPRSVRLAELASSKMTWQCGQMAATISASRALSSAQPVSVPAGSGLAAPFWFSTVRHPAPVAGAQAARPFIAR